MPDKNGKLTDNDYLELLTPHISEDQKKYKRNCLISSFVISSIYFLNKSLTDIKLFGIEISENKSLTIISIAAILIIYWLVMFIIYYFKDRGIQKEKRYTVNRHANDMDNSLKTLKQLKKKAKKEGKSFEGSIGHDVSVYKEYLERTKSTRVLNAAIFTIEVLIPIAFTIFALYTLVDSYLKLETPLF